MVSPGTTPARRWVDAVAVAVLLLAACGQWILFSRYVRREVAWSFPANYDQAHYLHLAYGIHQRAQDAGWFEALRRAQVGAPPTG